MEKNFRVGDWLVRPALNRIEGGNRVSLEPRTMQVLVHLAENSDRVCSKESLMEAVWQDAFVSDEALTNAMSKLRQALGDDARNPRYIETVVKKGYRLMVPVQSEDTALADGHYRIVRKLGSNAFGEVLLAEDPTLKRPVVLKVIGEPSPEAAQRQLREAQAAAALDNPFVCKVYHSGLLRGRPFIAMEFLQGERLDRLMSKRRLSLGEVRRIGLEIVEALQAAHQKGIIHRGLRPQKLFLDRQGHAKVMDFGLAKRLPAESGQGDWSQSFSLSGTVGGHPYMSPEQITGQKDLDFRSDYFSLGVLLYEMLSGRHPFLKKSDMHTAVAIVTEPTPSWGPSTLPSSPGLRNLTERLLQKKPIDRPKALSEVARLMSDRSEEAGAARSVSQHWVGHWLKPALTAVALGILALVIWVLLG